LQSVITKNDVNGIFGSGSSYEIQLEAGVDESDIFLAVTENDELNMIASVIAKNLGSKYTFARVRKSEYSNLSKIAQKSLGIDYIINPELKAAERILQLVEFPQAYSYELFNSKKAPIVEMKVHESSKLIGQKISNFRNIYKNIIICCVIEGDDVFIPNGDYIIKENINIFVTGPIEEIEKLFRNNGQDSNKIKSTIIIGGGLITNYLLRLLSKTKTQVKVFEIDEEKAYMMSAMFPNAEIINDDGTSIENLKEQRIGNYDSLVALTGIDEENIITSISAKYLGVKKTVTKVSRSELLDVLGSVGLQSVINPKRIIADSIVQIIRSIENSTGSNVETLHTIANENVEALQFIVSDKSKLKGIKIKDLNMKEGNLLAYIYRDEEVIFPRGDDVLESNDRVLLITLNRRLKDLDEILI